MKAGLIGTGTIGSAVAAGIARNGHAVTVSRRNEANSTRLAEQFPQVEAAENQDVVDASEVVFIALTTDDAAGAVKALNFREEQAVVSLMAEIDLATLQEWIGPAEAGTTMIPFPQIATGGSPLLVLGDDAPVHHYFGRSDTVFTLDSKKELDAFLCAQAVLSPAAVLVSRTAAWVGEKAGQSEKAEMFLRTLVASSLAGMPSDDLIAALDTPGGYNQRLRRFFEDNGLHDLIERGLAGLERVDGG